MRTWTFKDYVIIEETDLLRVETLNGDLLGYIIKNGLDEVNALNNGANPIAERWEDGNGNTITLDGWAWLFF